MRILEIILFEYVLGYVLQGFAYSLGIYAFYLKKVEARKYITVSVICIVISILMRVLLVKHFGFHTILVLICLFLLGVFYLKMPAFASIRSILAITILLIITELLSIFLMTNVLGPDKVEVMMNDRIGKSIIALPSSILFALFITVLYFGLLKFKRKKSIKNGEDGTRAF